MTGVHEAIPEMQLLTLNWMNTTQPAGRCPSTPSTLCLENFWRQVQIVGVSNGHPDHIHVTEMVLTCTATANMLLTLILAVTKFPEVQVKARKELDAVCGTERTPLFSDFDDLPYINCIIKEGLRWRPTFVDLLRENKSF